MNNVRPEAVIFFAGRCYGYWKGLYIDIIQTVNVYT